MFSFKPRANLLPTYVILFNTLPWEDNNPLVNKVIDQADKVYGPINVKGE